MSLDRTLKRSLFLLPLFMFCLACPGGTRSALAGLRIDQSMSYLSNSVAATDTDTFSHYHFSVSFSATFTKSLALGWKTTTFGQSQKSSAGTMTLSGLEMGPRAAVYLNKSHTLNFSLAYLPVHNADHKSTGGVTSELSGSGFDFEIAFHPEVTSLLSPGFSILYHLGSYSSSKDTANAVTTVSNSRNGFYPSIYLHWKFGGE